jgi:hypothetical protein
MLTELQSIRRLLDEPNTANIRAANEGLQTLALSIETLSGRLFAQHGTVKDNADFLMRLRAELSSICALLQNASTYFNQLGLLHASQFGAYERTGEFRSLDSPRRVSMQL